MLLCPLYCIFKAGSSLWYCTHIENRGFSDKSESVVFKENATQGRADIVGLGNRFEGITSTATNAGNAESSARRIAGSTDINVNLHSGSNFLQSSVLLFVSDNL